MMPPWQNEFAISVEIEGPTKIAKASFPLRYGKYSVIKTSEYEFRFNLNGEIKFIRGLNVNWPHPAEQLKRTDGNDWVYYSVGDQSGEEGVISWLGEYYLPCLPYPSNSIWEINYFANPDIMNAFAAWAQLYANLYGANREGLHPKANDLVTLILQNDDRVLYKRSQQLNAIIGERVSVLPPDTRHVDYEVIPLMVADGCLYHCDFCCVKTARHFRARSRIEIREQIRQLKAFYGRNLDNYHALYLGNHDALAAGEELICQTAREAGKVFGFADTRANTPTLFIFGSVDSLLRSQNALFDQLSDTPFYTYINIGFESVDPTTLEFIGKPVSAGNVREAFAKMTTINTAYPNIEVTGNFLIGKTLPRSHVPSLVELLENASAPSHDKGVIYLSPVKDSPKKRELLPQFLDIKNRSHLSTFVYLIQRL